MVFSRHLALFAGTLATTLLAVVLAKPVSATSPSQDRPRMSPVAKCNPATGADDWKNAAYDKTTKTWTAERDITLACVKPKRPPFPDIPCAWCYQEKLEFKDDSGNWVEFKTDTYNWTLECDGSDTKTVVATVTGPSPGTTYRLTSQIAVDTCDSPNPVFMFMKTITFTVN